MSYTITLPDLDAVNIVLLALSKAPLSWEVANPLILLVQQQAQPQLPENKGPPVVPSAPAA